MTTVGNATDALSQYAVGSNKKKSDLGQADFLRLMTEQLKNQDPLKPLDGTQMLGQLAQFSTVQGINGMQDALGAVANVMESDQTLRAASLVGHDALVDTDTVQLQAGTGMDGEVVATSAGTITIEIVDSAGQVVDRMPVEAAGAGNVAWSWDGRNADGAIAPAGTYKIRAVAGSGASSQALSTRVAAHVDSVSIEASGLVLNLAGVGPQPLSAVRRIG
ncbi:basal-body rod modification protein FlgD [Lysobacter xinjiangensis]|uniref:Basal-body rod modification protein FlgD n=1 Tax=Cognatilysobacter xinjiangensis TaxID=546892 RepID=A0ABQ3BSH6_9GAMM|nr:flagellar hook assembly protein FlgD [Lysobacter xinjiangensis]GGZ52971.1 basal-body rod modification protein FlgD [Lysobacter xinjiangensis]